MLKKESHHRIVKIPVPTIAFLFPIQGSKAPSNQPFKSGVLM